jgi:hypothetical protein
MLPKTSLEEVLKLHQEGKLCGVYNLSNKDYHASPGLSRSALCDIGVSPKYYKHRLSKAGELKEALIFGSAYHCKLLQDEPFDSLFYITKTQPREPKLDDQGRMPLSEKNLETIESMRESFYESELNRRVLNGHRELSFFWTDPASGVLCKCKPDILLPNGVLVDLKTASSINDASVKYSIRDYGYDVQGSFQIDGINLALEQSGKDIGLKMQCHSFVLAFQEKAAPFDTNIIRLGPEAIMCGEALYKDYINIYANCLRSKQWPGMTGNKIREIDHDPWYVNKIMEDRGHGS